MAVVKSVANESVNTILERDIETSVYFSRWGRDSLTVRQRTRLHVRSATTGWKGTHEWPGVGHTKPSLLAVFHSQSKCCRRRPSTLPRYSQMARHRNRVRS